MMTNEQAKALLGRGFLPQAFEILWKSVAYSAALSAIDYFLQPKAFTRDDVIINFIGFVIILSVTRLFVLLMAAGRYRKRPKNWNEDAS